MGTAQHRLKNNKAKRNQSKYAYKPKPPFRSVEGIESLAYEKLSPHAVWVLMELYRKFNGYNRSCLYLSYEEVKHKISNGTFNKSIWELIGFGFIEVIRYGRLERNNSLYGFTNRWKKLSEHPKKLHKIEILLSHAYKVKRIETPKNLNEEDKKNFGVKRRKLLRKIRNKIIKLR